MYWITIERSKVRQWNGHKIPLSIYVRLHYRIKRKLGDDAYIRAGSRIWFQIIGPNVFTYIKALDKQDLVRELEEHNARKRAEYKERFGYE